MQLGQTQCGSVVSRGVATDPLVWAAIAAGPLGLAVWLGLTGQSAPEFSLHDPFALLLLLAAYPLLEEWVFRGLLQGRLLETGAGRARFGPLTLANTLTALAFAAFHFPRGGLVLAAGVLLPGLLFGYLRERHGSILPAVLLHAWYNACVVLWALQLAPGTGIESPVAGACRPEPELVAARCGIPRQHIACH